MKHQSIYNLDEMDDPSEFRNWKDLESEQESMLEELIGGTGLV